MHVQVDSALQDYCALAQTNHCAWTTVSGEDPSCTLQHMCSILYLASLSVTTCMCDLAQSGQKLEQLFLFNRNYWLTLRYMQ